MQIAVFRGFFAQGRKRKSAVSRHAPRAAGREKGILRPMERQGRKRKSGKRGDRMMDKHVYRDVAVKDIDESCIGRTVKAAGWVENIRDHGGVCFLDLRDMYGVLQVVIRDGEMLKGITKEASVSVEGPIQQRDEETYNPRIPTGTVELEAHKITVLGKVYRQLPFEVMTSKETREDVRLKYRY